MPRFRVTSIVIASLAAALPARAQVARPIGIEQGARIRFEIGGDQSFRSGVLARFTSDSLIVERCPTCQGRLEYGRSELTRLDVSRRIPATSRVLNGFAIGGITGFALGYLLAATCRGGGDRCDAGIVVFAFGGLFGSLVGASAGYLTAYKWEAVPIGR